MIIFSTIANSAGKISGPGSLISVISCSSPDPDTNFRLHLVAPAISTRCSGIPNFFSSLRINLPVFSSRTAQYQAVKADFLQSLGDIDAFAADIPLHLFYPVQAAQLNLR